jgi:hypothetical protein
MNGRIESWQGLATLSILTHYTPGNQAADPWRETHPAGGEDG